MTDSVNEIASSLTLSSLQPEIHIKGVKVDAPDGEYKVIVSGARTPGQIIKVEVRGGYANLGQLIFATAEALHLQQYHGRFIETVTYNNSNNMLEVWVGS